MNPPESAANCATAAAGLDPKLSERFEEACFRFAPKAAGALLEYFRGAPTTDGYLVIEVAAVPAELAADYAFIVRGPAAGGALEALRRRAPSLDERLREPVPGTLYLAFWTEGAGRRYDKTVLVYCAV